MSLSDSGADRHPVMASRHNPRPTRVSPDDPYLLSQRAVPNTPADQTGAFVDCFPARAAFPITVAGRHPRLAFRGLLRLHSCYGPLDCSAAQGDLCHEAPTQPVTQ